MTIADLPEPLPAFRVRLDIGETTAGWFTECTGLTIERSVKEFAEGGVNDHQQWLPGPVHRSNVTLRRGIMGPELWQWFSRGLYDTVVERRAVTVIFFDVQRNEAWRWELADAVPIRWAGPELKSESGEVAVEELEIGQGTGGGEEGGGGASERHKPGIDVSQLAAKVYDLLREEVRSESARLGRGLDW